MQALRRRLDDALDRGGQGRILGVRSVDDKASWTRSMCLAAVPAIEQ